MAHCKNGTLVSHHFTLISHTLVSHHLTPSYICLAKFHICLTLTLVSHHLTPASQMSVDAGLK